MDHRKLLFYTVKMKQILDRLEAIIVKKDLDSFDVRAIVVRMGDMVSALEKTHGELVKHRVR